jgi:hypothetical protein
LLHRFALQRPRIDQAQARSFSKKARPVPTSDAAGNPVPSSIKSPSDSASIPPTASSSHGSKPLSSPSDIPKDEKRNSSSGLARFLKLTALAAMGLGGGALLATMLGFTLDEMKESITALVSGKPRKPVNDDPPVEAPPPLPLPDEFIHPYDLLPWYQRYWFMFRRMIYLVHQTSEHLLLNYKLIQFADSSSLFAFSEIFISRTR